MAKFIEVSGRNIDDAKKNALTELNLPAERVVFEVLEEPSKGFFGLIGNKVAKIRATVRELSPEEKADNFLTGIFTAMNMHVDKVQRETDIGTLFELSGENMGIMIGKHGQTLDALQYLTNLAANKDSAEDRKHIVLDVENYRERREDTLKHLAERIADKVRTNKRKVILEPMNRHERKVIHIALQDETDIVTYSDGEEPYRKIVVDIKNKK
ncbi:RNA-binding cell elongation regulator Jag/EloR [Pectinatus brassicae]|uniref:RNA-binding protein KhpB n=1 Tax=Pectinatus brassicae TaxID=862415 RepID=A0A840UIX1_9FIRM|nr:RNA-binding cell elongation regulator Jag/EloR [Pectinatus brassicae]MBB5336929.1 spoIIIJ-associated protein [Pectinatus brassicae]